MHKKLNLRASAAKICWQIIDKGQSLDSCLSEYFDSANLAPADRGLVQEMVYGLCRWYGELDSYASSLLQKPIRNKDRVIHFLLLIGLYQLKYMSTPAHAAVSETVAGCQQLQKNWAKNLLNGCLRTWQREADNLSLAAERACLVSHPSWLAEELENSWGDAAHLILQANNDRPTMCLRVNQRQCSREEYINILAKVDIEVNADPFTQSGLRLKKPCGVGYLPKFSEGAVSVQDTAAQLAAEILRPQRGDKVLDACAAPGGKAAHLLEMSNNGIDLDAIDVSETRIAQTKETFERLKLSARVYVADATQPPTWPVPKHGYDQILIDAPCSGTGVIRRHPDIRHHRRAGDIDQLELTQAALLRNLWGQLKKGGKLLYMTCSVIPRENELQIERFLAFTESAQIIKFDHPSAISLDQGYQTLPGVHEMDGFYFCLLSKL